MSTTTTTINTVQRSSYSAKGLDFESHPAEIVQGGKVSNNINVQDLRNAIPAYCFKPTLAKSFFYLFRDLILVSGLMTAAFKFIPLIENPLLRYSTWGLYGWVQGLAMTGIWVIGHESGHSNFSTSNLLNDIVGWTLHSALLTPYFSWKSSHRRHHIYANNLAKDHNYVPPQREEYANSLLFDVNRLEELTEDSPIVTFLRIVLQQVIGFPWYLLTNITASQGSLHKPHSKKILGNSHFLPHSTIFRPEEGHLIVLSDLGIGLMAAGLYLAATKIGFELMALLYLQPYMWVNHWIVAITYLHHTHPNLPKFEPEAWTFLKGATATVDREFGFIGKHMFHNIIEFHVIHHLFSRIPQYYAEEATKKIIPLLGDAYHSDKHRKFLPSLWESFTRCQWVEPDDASKQPKDRAMWYKAGPSPPVEAMMTKKNSYMSDLIKE
ncbi:MAG: hypothetical protein Q9217_006886 [Psora testacea]